MSDLVSKMKIDERKEEINFGDHCLVSLNLKLRVPSTKTRARWELVEYYKKNQMSINRFIEELKGR